MKRYLSNIFRFSDLQYKSILTLSFFLAVFTLYFDLRDIPSQVQFLYLSGYAVAFIFGFVWSIFNYIHQIKLNSLYQKSSDIEAFVSILDMEAEEKLEIKMYLEDYIQDLMSEGASKEAATTKAINQFKIEEISSLTKTTSILNLPPHHYLLGYALGSILVGVLIRVLYQALPSLSLLCLASTLILYGVALGCTFIFYRLLDVIFHKQFTN